MTETETRADVSRLAYEAALAELRERGVEWTEVDTERLRFHLGRLGNPEWSDPDFERADRLLRKLGLALSTPPVAKALREVRAFADDHPMLSSSSDGAVHRAIALGAIGGPVDQLFALAQETPRKRFVETKWRELLTDYAFQECGWWSQQPIDAHTLAILSVLADIPVFTDRNLSGRDAIAHEAKAMKHHLKRKEDQRRAIAAKIDAARTQRKKLTT